MDDFPMRLRLLRKEQRMTQAEFAAELGVSTRTVSRYETGLSKLDIADVKIICDKFGVSQEWLALGIGSMLPGGQQTQEQAERKEDEEADPMVEGQEFYVTLFEELKEAHGRERELLKENGELKTVISKKDAEIEKLTMLLNSLEANLGAQMFTPNQETDSITSGEKKTA